VRARYVVLLLLFPWLLELIPGFANPLLEIGEAWPWYWWSTVYYGLSDGLFAGALALLAVVVWQLPIDKCLGRPPTRSEVFGGLKLTAFTFVASLTLLYLTFYPLSFVVPDFVQWWYIDSYLPLVYYDYDYGFHPFVANLLWLVLLCVVTPILEEFTFRGILLPRWTHKWGLSAGVLTSSALFAALHSDPFGAFVFGIAMCILYLKSQSLTLSMLCHGLYNFAVWLLDLVDELTLGPDYVFTLEELQASWPWGIGAAAVTGAWAVVYLYRPKSDVPWRLPVA